MKYGKRLFDSSYLFNAKARFVLVGVINRMDRAYKSPETCGETRRVCSPQSGTAGSSTGGFLNGSIRTKTCDGLSPEAVCGPLPAAKSGFNMCLTQKSFAACIKEYATGAGLRGCDFKNPCRDDYICSESFDNTRGACVPPYFLFQFRVDGHPL